MKLIDQHTPVAITVASKLPSGQAAVALLVPVDATAKSVDLGSLAPSLKSAVQMLRSEENWPTAANEIVVQQIGDTRLVLVGIPDEAKRSIHSYRDASAVLAKWARKHRMPRLALLIDARWPQGSHEIAAGCATGLSAGYFLLDRFKGTGTVRKSSDAALEATLVVEASAQRFAALAVKKASTIAACQNFVRALGGHPGNVLNPQVLAKVAQDAAKSVGLQCRVLDEKQMARLGMGGMLAVGMGSPDTPPRMIVLEWPGAARQSAAPVLLVGKAITFDTGGISIKPREGMQRMVFDKCGAMAVLGTMLALARLKSPRRVIGVLAAAENHVSASAYRPGDILTMHNGVTVEITNTDAEGRLVLADALSWGIATFKPSAVVDLATLTGGVLIALGKEYAGLFANHDGLAAELSVAGSHHGEKLWRLPISEEAREMMKSDHADLVNSAGRHAHAIQGAEFLRRFVPEDGSVPWAHLDIAGVADVDKPVPMYTPGATGWGVRTLVDWIASREPRLV